MSVLSNLGLCQHDAELLSSACGLSARQPGSKRDQRMNKTFGKPTAPTTAVDADCAFAAVINAFKSKPQVTYGGKGFGSTALKVNRRIFAMLSSKGKFIVKLPKARVAELVGARKGEYFDPGSGKLMKGWLVVSAGSDLWINFAREACRFVQAYRA